MTGEQRPLFSDEPRGETFDPEQDGPRLRSQLERVRSFLLEREGRWLTLELIGRGADAPEASVSARLRDLQKPQYGGFIVEKRRAAPGRGLWVYRLRKTVPEG
jgi:hypothetical protein